MVINYTISDTNHSW